MAIKDFSVGVPFPTAADLNTYLIQQQHAVKPSNESVTNSTTLQNDDHLALPMSANTTYFIQGMFIISGAEAADMAFKWAVPSGATFNWVSDTLGSSATGSATGQVSRTSQGNTNQPAFGLIAGNTTVVPFKGLIVVGSTGGVLRATWAQNVASATATVMNAGSYMMARRCI